MANTKEIQSRINSIHDTMKITKAMYMMSSVKLRKARQKLEDTEPYFYGLQDQIKSILYHFPTMQHLFFDNRNSDMHEQIKKKAFIVISGPLIAELTIPSTGGWECWKTLQTDIVKPVTGIQDICNRRNWQTVFYFTWL